jgi:hypothetical protein
MRGFLPLIIITMALCVGCGGPSEPDIMKTKPAKPTVGSPKTTTAKLLVIDFTSPDSKKFLGDGWASNEMDRRWSIDAEAVVNVPLNKIQPLSMELTAKSFTAQSVVVRVNGMRLGILNFSGTQFEVQKKDIPTAMLKRKNLITFSFPESKSPKSVGFNADARNLGIAVRTLKFVPKK